MHVQPKPSSSKNTGTGSMGAGAGAGAGAGGGGGSPAGFYKPFSGDTVFGDIQQMQPTVAESKGPGPLIAVSTPREESPVSMSKLIFPESGPFDETPTAAGDPDPVTGAGDDGKTESPAAALPAALAAPPQQQQPYFYRFGPWKSSRTSAAQPKHAAAATSHLATIAGAAAAAQPKAAVLKKPEPGTQAAAFYAFVTQLQAIDSVRAIGDILDVAAFNEATQKSLLETEFERNWDPCLVSLWAGRVLGAVWYVQSQTGKPKISMAAVVKDGTAAMHLCSVVKARMMRADKGWARLRNYNEAQYDETKALAFFRKFQ